MENEVVRYDYEDKPIRSRAFRKQEKACRVRNP